MPQKILSAINDGNNDKAARLAHTLKGLAANIGGSDLHAAVENLESSMKGDVQGAIASLDRVSHSVEIMRIGIVAMEQKEDEKADSGSGLKVAAANEEVVPLLEELESLLEEHDSQAVKRFSEVKAMPWELAIEKELVSIEQKIKRYDFDGALFDLRELVAALKRGN